MQRRAIQSPRNEAAPAIRHASLPAASACCAVLERAKMQLPVPVMRAPHAECAGLGLPSRKPIQCLGHLGIARPYDGLTDVAGLAPPKRRVL